MTECSGVRVVGEHGRLIVKAYLTNLTRPMDTVLLLAAVLLSLQLVRRDCRQRKDFVSLEFDCRSQTAMRPQYISGPEGPSARTATSWAEDSGTKHHLQLAHPRSSHNKLCTTKCSRMVCDVSGSPFTSIRIMLVVEERCAPTVHVRST